MEVSFMDLLTLMSALKENDRIIITLKDGVYTADYYQAKKEVE